MSTDSIVLKRGSDKWLVAAILAVVGLIVGSLVIMPMAAPQPPAVAAKVEDSIQRSREASTARYAAMDTFYGTTTALSAGDNLRRSLEASAARYAAMGAFYAAMEAANVQRGVEASAARYAAMGEYYATAK